MAEFKVGDKVEMVRRNGGHGCYADFKNPGVVKQVYSNTYGVFLDAADSAGSTFYGADESRFTAYVEPNPSFKVGEKVEVVNDDYRTIASGTQGVVLGLKDGNYRTLVQFAGRSDLHNGGRSESVNADCWWFSVENLKLVEPKPELLKVGQKVRVIDGGWHQIGDIGEIIKVENHNESELDYKVLVGKMAFWQARKDIEAITDTPKTGKSDKHWIIAKIVCGQPRPSFDPYVHLSESAAVLEAQRLATTHPGTKFVMYAARYEAFVEPPKPVEPDLQLRWL